MHDLYSDSLSIKLTEWIAISAAVMALFTFTMPHLHHLRVWSAIALGLIFVFTFIAVGIAIKDGASVSGSLRARPVQLACRTGQSRLHETGTVHAHCPPRMAQLFAITIKASALSPPLW